MLARRFLIRGGVQGVGFRYFVIAAARRLGLSGWTRNLNDGRVEVMAQGESDRLDLLAGELARGPLAARVEAVEAADLAPDPALNGFDVRY